MLLYQQVLHSLRRIAGAWSVAGRWTGEGSLVPEAWEEEGEGGPGPEAALRSPPGEGFVCCVFMDGREPSRPGLD